MGKVYSGRPRTASVVPIGGPRDDRPTTREIVELTKVPAVGPELLISDGDPEGDATDLSRAVQNLPVRPFRVGRVWNPVNRQPFAVAVDGMIRV